MIIQWRWRTDSIDLIGWLQNYGWRFVTLHRSQWPKPSQKKKKCKKAKWLSERALQIAEERREVKGKGERDITNWMQKIARRDKKSLSQYITKFGKLSSGHRTGKGQFSFQSQRRAMSNNVKTTVLLHSFQMQERWCSKSFKLGFRSMWTKNFQM